MNETKIFVNGKEEAITGEKISITDLLKFKRVEMPDMVSVELNGKILEKGVFPSTFVKNGDKVEFLYFMGGG